MIGLDLSEVKKKMVEVGGSGEQVGEGEVFCSQGVAHMAEPNVTLMTGSLSLWSKSPPEGSHTWPIFLPRVLCDQPNQLSKEAVDQRFGIRVNLKIISVWPKSGADKTGP